MKTSMKMAALGSVFVLSLTAVSAAGAQGTAGVGARVRARERVRDHRADVRQHLATMTPAQKAAYKAYEKAYLKERKLLHEQIEAGTLTKESAAEQLKAWRQANRPPTP
jgi:hypothetical protein